MVVTVCAELSPMATGDGPGRPATARSAAAPPPFCALRDARYGERCAANTRAKETDIAFVVVAVNALSSWAMVFYPVLGAILGLMSMSANHPPYKMLRRPHPRCGAGRGRGLRDLPGNRRYGGDRQAVSACSCCCRVVLVIGLYFRRATRASPAVWRAKLRRKLPVPGTFANRHIPRSSA